MGFFILRHSRGEYRKENKMKRIECKTCHKRKHAERYAKKHWLDVMWLCFKCHSKLDAAERRAS
jgi:hypothetical protein